MDDDYVLCAYKGGKDNGANISERIIIDDLSSPLLPPTPPTPPTQLYRLILLIIVNK